MHPLNLLALDYIMMKEHLAKLKHGNTLSAGRLRIASQVINSNYLKVSKINVLSDSYMIYIVHQENYGRKSSFKASVIGGVKMQIVYSSVLCLIKCTLY